MPIMYQVLGIQWRATQTQSVPLWSLHPGWEWGWGKKREAEAYSQQMNKKAKTITESDSGHKDWLNRIVY